MTRPKQGTRPPRRLIRPGVNRLEARSLLTADFRSAFALPVGDSIDGGLATAVVASGEMIVTGDFAGTVDFDPGPGTATLTSTGGRDAYVACYSPSSRLLWARRLGGDQEVIARGVAVAPSGAIIVTGSFRGTADFDPGAGVANLTSAGGQDAFVIALDPDGGLTWARRFGSAAGEFDRGVGVSVDRAGNVLVTGGFFGTVDFDPGPGTVNLASAGDRDVFVLKLDLDGNLVWARRMGGAGADEGRALAVDGTGAATLGGSFRGVVDFDPGPAASNLSAGGGDGLFVVRLDPEGDLSWAGGLASSGFGFLNGSGLSVDGTGAVIVAGDFRGTIDFDPGPGVSTLSAAGLSDLFILKLNSSGGFTWARGAGGTGFDAATGVAFDPTGFALVVGTFTGGVDFDPGPGTVNLTSAGDQDVVVARFDPEGRLDWARGAGGPRLDFGAGIAVDGTGRIAVVGSCAGPASFGRFSLPDPGASTVVVVRMGPPGVQGDFDGDGKADLAVFRSSEARWLSLLTSGDALNRVFGAPSLVDLPVPADYDGDGKADLAVFRMAEARWLVRLSGGGYLNRGFGAPNLVDLPVPADYDGDGKADLAVFRPSEARWLAQLSGGGVVNQVFGATGLADLPIPADYDGDGKADLAVFRPSEARWLSVLTGGDILNRVFGAPSLADLPIPADYDGDGKADLAVFRPVSSRWLGWLSGGTLLDRTFGAPNGADLPTPAPIAALKAMGRLGEPRSARPLDLVEASMSVGPMSLVVVPSRRRRREARIEAEGIRETSP